MNLVNHALMVAESAARVQADLWKRKGYDWSGVGHVQLDGYILGVDVSLDGISYWYVQAGAEGLHGMIASSGEALAFIEEHMGAAVTA